MKYNQCERSPRTAATLLEGSTPSVMKGIESWAREVKSGMIQAGFEEEEDEEEDEGVKNEV